MRMDRRTFMHTAAFVGAQGALANAAIGAGNEENSTHLLAESHRRIQKAMSAALAMQRRDWEQGMLAQLTAGGRRPRARDPADQGCPGAGNAGWKARRRRFGRPD